MLGNNTQRRAVIETALKMSASGLSPGRSGNVSARVDGGFLITPTGMAYEQLQTEDVVFVDDDGCCPAGQLRPSSEWRFHHDIYRHFPKAQGIVHCHSRHATALACAGKAIPAFHYMVAAADGSEIPLAPYALFGTQKLSDHVVAAMQGVRGVLMEHHGQVATGDSVDSAYELAQEIEELAAQYVLTLTLGSDRVLGNQEMQRVLEKFGSYGQQDSEDEG